MQKTVLSRLISARFLLENSGAQLNKNSTSRSVARAVLNAHDAAELFLAATAEHLGVRLNPRTTFDEVLDGVRSHNNLETGFFTRLNKVRVAFKHHGELPDATSWFDVIDATRDRLSDLCVQVFKLPLGEIDYSEAIEDKRIRELISEAKTLGAEGNNKEGLEKLSLALHRAKLLSPQNIWIDPGVPDTQMALILAGYGVEPSSFIILQQLIPELEFKDPKWKLHGMGHPGNWTTENLEFCIDTLIDLISILQSAPGRPQPTEFYEFFRDVATLKVDSPIIRKGQYWFFLSGPQRSSTQTIKHDLLKGDRIAGKISASMDDFGTELKAEIDSDDVEWLRIEQVDCAKIQLEMSEYLVVHRADVDLTFEEDPKSRRRILTNSDREAFSKNWFDV